MAKRPDVRTLVDDYGRLCAAGSADLVLEATRESLSHRHYLLVARAAEVAGDRLFYDLERALTAAYGRFLENPVKRDPHCTAKGAIVRALVSLDFQDAGFYLDGIRYRQLEPVWGGTQDTAVDLRCTCAAGLAATSYPRALIHLVDLLHDPEPHARSGSIRAIACVDPLGAEAVLRAKALSGDPEPEVMGDCLSALLQVAPDHASGFVARFLSGGDETRRTLAALALGESRLDAALDALRECWEAQPFKRDEDRVLLRAAVLHRTEAAFAWLLEVAGRGDKTSAALVVDELAVYRANQALATRLEAALAERGDEGLTERFRRLWRTGG